MKRYGFVVYGVVCYFIFFATFVYAIGFVGDLVVPRSVDAGGPSSSIVAALAIDTLLLSLFAIQHSVMARRGFKRLWTKLVPVPIERSTYVLCASSCLIALFYFWRPIPAIAWSVDGELLSGVLRGISCLGWGLVLVGTFLINHFDLFGLRQVYFAARRTAPPPHQFRTPMLYRIVRHPIYLGFIVAFWATPTMTVGHLLFATATLGYIVVAIRFEERDLVREYGDAYVAYRREVRGLVPLPKRQSAIVIAALALPCAASVHGGVANAGKRVTICHVPPGNPSQRHTISVCQAAVGAHLAHGDQLGACVAGCGSDPSVCDDGNACTSDSCGTDGECHHDALSCDDGDLCTDDTCDAEAGCTHESIAEPPEAIEVSCNDGLDNDCDGTLDDADSSCTTCGDGVLHPGEQCDDGNDNPFDGCDGCILVDITPD